jgi:hypothetical protein
MDVRDPPKLCPACGRDVSAATCGGCGYEQSRELWRCEEFPRLQRAARADGAVSIAIAMMVAIPAVLFALVLGTSSSSLAWVGWVFAALFALVSVVFARVGVDRIRSVGLPVLWSYADGEAVSMTSSFGLNGMLTRMQGRRDEWILFAVSGSWRSVAPTDENASALARWLLPMVPTDVPEIVEIYRRNARCALALMRLAAIGAVNLVVQQRTSWSRDRTGYSAPYTQWTVAIARGHGALNDEPSWALERLFIDALDRAFAGIDVDFAPTPEAVHYRQTLLREGRLPTVSLATLFDNVGAQRVLGQIRATLDSAIEKVRAGLAIEQEGGATFALASFECFESERVLVDAIVSNVAITIDEVEGVWDEQT